MSKLPNAKDWKARNIEDWNTLTFTEYLRHKHRTLFDIEYAPMRSWQVEQKLISTLIGTATKKGTHSKAVVKRFIDEAFETYSPTEEYPGTNFGFTYSYRRNLLQKAEAEEASNKRQEESRENAPKLSDLTEWL